MTEPIGLLPCPFCGCAPTTIERPDNIDGTQFFYAIACYCGHHSACAHKMAVRKTPEIAKADAITAWNTRAPQPTQAQAGAVPLTYQQVIAAWNAQADEHNQWGDLGEDEKIEWAAACAKAAPPAVVAPLTDEQIEREWQFLHDEEGNHPDHSDFARAIEAAHGIGIKDGDSHG